jgi:lantibiotic leader peptide-processing serine protease
MQHLTMQHPIRYGFPAALVMLGLAACTDVRTPTDASAPAVRGASVSASENGKHIVVFTGDDAPADFEARVSARGGSVDEILTGAGLAIVNGLTDAGAADLASTDGVRSVAADMILGPEAPDELAVADAAQATAVTPQVSSDAVPDPFAECHASTSAPAKATAYLRQWNLCAIKAYTAWDAGFVGSPDVKVFLLDTGIDYENADLQGLVDPDLSISLVPATSSEHGSFKGKKPYMDFHSHATGVASLISSNAKSLAGVTQKTTLVSVKVLDRTRKGAISVFLRGIYYAANHGADVIHFSFAFEGFNKRDSTGQVAGFNKATAYAHRKGAVMVVAGGNFSVDLDHNQDNWRVCDTPHVICVSATGPTAADGANGGWTNVDAPATYSNFGRSSISVAGPGGTIPPDASDGTFKKDTGLPVTLNCSGSSLISTGKAGPVDCGKNHLLRWESTGTSFGAAVTSGLAALLVSRMGHGRPDQIRAVIEKSADDLGQTGTDPYYGKGRINVARAMAMVK